MKTPEWLKELRSWLATAALLAIVVLAFVYVPGYMKRLDAERQEREALMKYIQETPPKEHIDRVKKAAKEQTAKEHAARDADHQ
jgi:hypothetical protein